MLMTRPRTQYTYTETSTIHNYYERLVIEAILETNPRAHQDNDFLADVSCVALNHLPPRYIRHDVDMSFFMSPVEREEIENKVKQAVLNAVEFVTEHEKEKKNQQEAEKAH